MTQLRSGGTCILNLPSEYINLFIGPIRGVLPKKPWDFTRRGSWRSSEAEVLDVCCWPLQQPLPPLLGPAPLFICDLSSFTPYLPRCLGQIAARGVDSWCDDDDIAWRCLSLGPFSYGFWHITGFARPDILQDQDIACISLSGKASKIVNKLWKQTLLFYSLSWVLSIV